jgi:hypothetical protein
LLTARNINILPWPAYSPDLNPIENLWGILVRRIYAENRQFQTREELQEAILEAWEEIDQRTIDNLVGSMPNRLFQLIQCNGGPIDYNVFLLFLLKNKRFFSSGRIFLWNCKKHFFTKIKKKLQKMMF